MIEKSNSENQKIHVGRRVSTQVTTLNSPIIMRMPGGASLYSLSVAWVSSLGRSRLKGFVRRSSALSCVLPSYDQASENRLTKGFKRTFC